MFHFGARTGIDLPNESRGLVPTLEYYLKAYGPNGWTKGNLANLAIGQGELLTTPLQMARFAMTLATKGVVHRPHIADYLYDKETKERIFFPIETDYIRGVSDDVYTLIREGMRDVVAGGTGWRGSVPGIEVAGKTGTSQNPHGEDHAWFIAFAPYEDPVIAIAVIVENGGGGGAVAAPIASKCMEKFFYNRLLPRAVAKKDTTQMDSLENMLPIDLQDVDRLRIGTEN
jgi:penicillin-binding protein 2